MILCEIFEFIIIFLSLLVTEMKEDFSACLTNKVSLMKFRV